MRNAGSTLPRCSSAKASGGVVREKRWRDLCIDGVTCEEAASRAETEAHNARTTFEQQKRR